eukprot:COSAG01_NODE_293_length_19376_cov_41.772060_19_plen_115_part_00
MRCGALVGGLQQAVPAPLVDEQQKSRPIAAHRCTAPNKRHAAASPVAQHSAHDGARGPAAGAKQRAWWRTNDATAGRARGRGWTRCACAAHSAARSASRLSGRFHSQQISKDMT